MFNFALKAKPVLIQLKDRYLKLKALGLKPIIELHLSGTNIADKNEVKSIVSSCMQFDCQYIVHVPVIDNKGGVFDIAEESKGWIDASISLAKEIGSEQIVFHRCFGYKKRVDYKTAKEEFDSFVIDLSLKYPRFTFYIENYGLVFFYYKNKKIYYKMGPLDHFFPQEIADFVSLLRKNKIENLFPMLDLAHAAISSNMFNLLKKLPSLYSKDRRFFNILLHSEEKVEGKLEVNDYLNASSYPYFHISDALVFSYNPGRSQVDIEKYILTEGLPLGEGDLPLFNILSKIKERNPNATLALEIISKDYSNATEQVAGVNFIRRALREEKGGNL